MDGGAGAYTPPNPPMFGNIDYDFMDQLLDEGCWLQTADGSNFLQPGSGSSSGPSTSSSLSYLSSYHTTWPRLEGDSSSLTSAPPHSYQEEGERWSSPNKTVPQDADLQSQSQFQFQSQSDQDQKAITPAAATASKSYWLEGEELNKFVWIAPMAHPGPSTSVKQRLMRAIHNLRDMNIDRDVLVQIWVPIKKGIRSFLTTAEQPHFYQPTSNRLLNYRDVSEKYEFLADEDTKQALGLPGRVFLGKAPEWTPNVRYFRQEEYPRIDYAHKYDVRGSIALPVFERGSRDCLGVVEIIMTTEKINYRPEVESVCKALESVDLRSSEIILNTPQKQAIKGSHEAVVPEILSVLKTVCDVHNLPLAQTWAPCNQQGKGGCYHSDKNALCVSTVDSACYVRDHHVLDFHKACSEHHLLRGRGGIVGKAFETNQPCFATDVTEFSKVDYPLSHHAKMYGLRAAVAIRLRSIYNESQDYVLEVYLPSDLQETGLTFHGRIWQSVLMVIQQQCRSLHFITVQDLEQQNLFGGKQIAENEMKLECSTSQKKHKEETSWFPNMMGPQRKGKDVALSLDFGDEEPGKEFKVTHWSNSESDLHLGQVFSDCGNINQDSNVERICGSSSGGRLPLGARRAGEKRRTKTQKTISLQVLRQYFAGSLKDAAKSMGVCPTTLKRICRQHGITRWPSRKIKKVGHSLRKLQLVIDSVQGAQGAIKISSFYNNFPELSSPNAQPGSNQVSAVNLNDQPQQQQQQLTTQPEIGILSSGATTSNSTSSSQTSTSSHCFSGGTKVSSPVATTPSGPPEDLTGSLKRARSEAELKAVCKKEPNQFLERSQSHKALAERAPPPETTLPSIPISKSWPSRDTGVFKAKVAFGEEKVRFTILPNMCYQDLQQEIAKRFNLDDMSKIGIKYLDDDKEWVLLTCDADLEECIDIHKSSKSHTIKLALSTIISSLGASFGSSGLLS